MDSFAFPTALAHRPNLALSLALLSRGSGAASKKAFADRFVLVALDYPRSDEAKAKAEQHMQEQMAEVTGGLNLPPGMKLPF